MAITFSNFVQVFMNISEYAYSSNDLLNCSKDRNLCLDVNHKLNSNNITYELINDADYNKAHIAYNRVEIAPIDDLITYNSALHEIGHILTTDLNHLMMVYRKIADEGFLNASDSLFQEYKEVAIIYENLAWDWAKTNTISWNSDVDKLVKECMLTYTDSPPISVFRNYVGI